MRARLWLISAVAVLISGCFNPDDIFPVHGTVTSPDGVQGVTVELLRAATADFGGPSCDDAVPFKTTTTNADGAFNFDLFRAQTQSLSARGLFCFRVRVAFPSGAKAWVDLTGINGEVSLQPLQDWRADPRVESGEFHFTPAVSDLAEREDAGTPVGHRLELRLDDGGVAWRAEDHVQLGLAPVSLPDGGLDLQPTGESQFTLVPLRFDARLVEDADVTARLLSLVPAAPVSELGPLQGGDSFPVWLEAAEHPRFPARTAPPSRGSTCASSTCRLSDGALDPVDQRLAQSVTLQLPAEVADAGYLVLRELSASTPVFSVKFLGADGGVVAQTTTLTGVVDEGLFIAPFTMLDAFSFTPRKPDRDAGVLVLDVPPRWVAVPVAPLAPVKSVTLSFASGVSSLAEISLW